MNTTLEGRYADLALRILLRCEEFDRQCAISISEMDDIDWDIFLTLARKNVITIRIFNKLQEMHVPISSEAYLSAVAKEQARIGRTLKLISQIDEVLQQEGMEFVFTKAFNHYPDMGHDIDLFVLDRSRKVDDLIIRSFSASASKSSLMHKLAGKEGYEISGYPSPLEIHHGRMGHVGEHSNYPKILMRNRQQVIIDGIKTYIPCLENQLIVCLLQRIYSHLYIRISDVIHTISILQNNNLNWDYILETTKEMGIFEGLCYFVTFVNDKYKTLTGKEIVDQRYKRVLIKKKLGGLIFKNEYFRFPLLRIAGRLYLKKFLFDIGRRNWDSIKKLNLMPLLALVASLRNLKRKLAYAKNCKKSTVRKAIKGEDWQRYELQRRHYDTMVGQMDLSSLRFLANGSKGERFALRAPYEFCENWFLKRNILNKKILDYGCGDGIHSIFPAKYEALVFGIDVSPERIKLAQERAIRENVEHLTHFEVGNYESLNFHNDVFDFIFSAGTLSCLDFKKAYSEFYRVLKPDGYVVIIDTLGHNPFLNLKRKMRFKKGLTTEWSVNHILKLRDFYEAQNYFEELTIHFFDLTTLAVAPFVELKKMPFYLSTSIVRLSQQVDKFLLAFPPLKKYAFKVVCILSKPRKKSAEGG